MTTVNELKNRTAHFAQPDPEVKLPAAIRAAAARSQTLHDQAYTPDAPAPQTPAQQPGNGGEEGNTPKPNAEAPRQEETRTEGDPAPAPATGADDWQHKYNSIKGRYDRAEETMRSLNGRIAQLEGLLASASAAPRQQPTPDLQFKSSITDKDRADFGEDFIDVASRAARDTITPEVAELRARLARLEGTVTDVSSKTVEQTRQTMYSYLDSQLPDWRKINRDPNFIGWTNLQDPLSGAIRLDMMKRAFDQGDAQRVLLFFKGFLSDEAAPAPVQAKPDPTGKVPLETFAAPGRAKAPAAATAPGEKETISQAQISQFYADVNRGKYRGNEAEKERLERMIFSAQAEGRIV